MSRLNRDLHLYNIIIIDPLVKTRFNEARSALIDQFVEFSSPRICRVASPLGQFLSYSPPCQIFEENSFALENFDFDNIDLIRNFVANERESAFRTKRNKWWNFFIARPKIDRSNVSRDILYIFGRKKRRSDILQNRISQIFHRPII